MRLELEELEKRNLLSASGLTPDVLTPLIPASSTNNTATVAASTTATTTASSSSSSSSSSDGVQTLLQVKPQQTVKPQATTTAVPGYTPQDIQQAYGIDQLLNGGTDGKGITIAIVDSSYDPNIVSDVAAFNTQFNLQQFNTTGGPTFQVVTSNGTPINATNGPSLGEDANWSMETSLDVEWAHSIAPGANILLVETPLDNNVDAPQMADLQTGVSYAANHANVVSMSWGDNESANETTWDNIFKQTPNVTFVAAAGDSGASTGPIWPATSPYVLAVGGTTLQTTANGAGGGGVGSTSGFGFGSTSGFGFGGGSSSGFGFGGGTTNGWASYSFPSLGSTFTFKSGMWAALGGAGQGGGLYSTAGSTTLATTATTSTAAGGYVSESGWYDGGGGYSQYEGEPNFQTKALGSASVAGAGDARMTPDVAFDADPNTGVAVYDSFQQTNPWIEVGGTSLGSPSWAGIIALTDQYRSTNDLDGGKSLGTYQVETTLYSALNTSNYSKDFHDIGSGNNGYAAATGYDLVTGLGSPVANNLVPWLASTTNATGLPTITGTGTGTSTAPPGGSTGPTGTGGTSGFPSSIFSSGFWAMSRGSGSGGGLYVASGSPSVAATPGATYAVSGTAGSSALAPAITPSQSAPVTSFTATAIPTAQAAPVASTTANNSLTSFSLAEQTTTPSLASNSHNLSELSNATATSNTTVFGASGWNKSLSSWQLSSRGLHGPTVEGVLDNLANPLSTEDGEAMDSSFGDGDVSGDTGVPILDPSTQAANTESAAASGDGASGGDG